MVAVHGPALWPTLIHTYRTTAVYIYIFSENYHTTIIFDRSCEILNEQVKEHEMGKACSTHGREEECIDGFGGKIRRK
jgi:hypothetical protein